MERIRPILIALGYSAWFSLLFVVFTWVTFPWTKVAEQITVTAADAGVAFQAEKLRPAVVGAKASGLVVGPLGGNGAPWLQAEKLKVKTGIGGAIAAALEVRSISDAGGAANGTELVRKLLGALGAVSLDGDMYGAEVDLDVSDDKGEAMRLALSTGKLDLSAYPIASDSFTATPTGRLKSDADLLWHWEDPKKSSGTIDLDFDRLHFTGFKVSGFSLPETTFDRAEAHIKLSKGRAEFRNTAFESDVVQAEITGFINLRSELKRSSHALQVKFKVREDLEGLLSVAGLKKDSRHRDKDGWFHYTVSGRLMKPRFKERRVSRPSSRTPKPSAAARDSGDEDEEPAVKRKPRPAASDDEPVSRPEMGEDRKAEIEAERARLREERLKRREERRKKREELMERRQAAQNGAEDEDEEEDVPSRVMPRIDPPDMDEFERTNDIDVEGEDDPGEPDEEGGDGGDGGEEFEE